MEKDSKRHRKNDNFMNIHITVLNCPELASCSTSKHGSPCATGDPCLDFFSTGPSVEKKCVVRQK